MSQVQEKGIFVIGKVECLRCAILAPGIEKKQFEGCYGRADCPATAFKIVVGTNIEKAAKAIASAMFDNDFAKVSKFMERLGKYDPIISAQIMTAVKSELTTMELQAELMGDDGEEAEEEESEITPADEQESPVDASDWDSPSA